jgi:putative DNA primase/helicase
MDHLRSVGWYPTRPIRVDGIRVECRIRGQVNADPEGFAILYPNGHGVYGRRGEQQLNHWRPSPPEKLIATLEYARHGLSVFPVHSVEAGRCSCGKPDCSSPGKHPRTPHGVRDASRDEFVIFDWWGQQWPDANIGIATGGAGGLLVIDIDGEEGARSLSELEAAHGPLPHTLAARTGRGSHLYFRLPADCGPVPCSASKLGKGIDVRADGGYVVAPPSAHPSGARYEFESGSSLTEIAAVPNWLLQLIAADRAQAQEEGPRVRVDELRISDELKRLIKEGKPRGERSEAIFRALRGLIVAGYGNDVIEFVMLDPANGLSEKPRVKGRVWLEGEIRRAREKPSASGANGNGSGSSPRDEPLELDPAEPLRAARLFVERHYTTNGLRTLHHHADAFYEWNGRCYRPSDPQAIRSKICAYLETALRPASKGTLVPFQPNTASVDNVVDAIAAIINVPSPLNLPVWLVDSADRPRAAEMVACANGLLHLPTSDLRSATPAFFSLNALDFEFDAAAPPPAEWLRFTDSIWDGDREATETLQEWFGYFLTSDTRQQKILLIVGPKRSGKGTIGRIATALLGQANVCAPTLASFGQNFGLAPLIGKQLAIIADARLSGRADQHAVAERLLSISGEDGITVERKFLESWTGRLTTRFLMLTNELPRIADASGALASRFIVLTLNESFFGREDHHLTDRLMTELPAILNWSIDGWRRLRDRGYFRQPASSAEAIQGLEDLGSTIGAFLRECCELGPDLSVACDELFQEWQGWCGRQGRDHPGSAQSFGRDLHAAVPGLKTVRPRLEDGGRERRYVGVALKEGRSDDVFPG